MSFLHLAVFPQETRGPRGGKRSAMKMYGSFLNAHSKALHFSLLFEHRVFPKLLGAQGVAVVLPPILLLESQVSSGES